MKGTTIAVGAIAAACLLSNGHGNQLNGELQENHNVFLRGLEDVIPPDMIKTAEDGKSGEDGKKGEELKRGEDRKRRKDLMKAPDGADGKKEADGADGKKPADGADGKKPADGADGKKPADGADGKKPADGADEKKPADGADEKKPADGSDGKKAPGGADGKKGDKKECTEEENAKVKEFESQLLGKCTDAFTDGSSKLEEKCKDTTCLEAMKGMPKVSCTVPSFEKYTKDISDCENLGKTASEADKKDKTSEAKDKTSEAKDKTSEKKDKIKETVSSSSNTKGTEAPIGTSAAPGAIVPSLLVVTALSVFLTFYF